MPLVEAYNGRVLDEVKMKAVVTVKHYYSDQNAVEIMCVRDDSLRPLQILFELRRSVLMGRVPWVYK